MQNTKELMHCYCGTNNRAPRWTFTDPCKPEVRPGARKESAPCLASRTRHECPRHKNSCTVTVAPTIEHHVGHSRTPANQR